MSGNLDSPEAALDALLQSVVCIEVGRSCSGINCDFSIPHSSECGMEGW